VWQGDEALAGEFARLVADHEASRSSGADDGRERLARVGSLLDAVVASSARSGGDDLEATWSWHTLAPGVEVPAPALAADAAAGLVYEQLATDQVRVGLSDTIILTARVEDGQWRLDFGALARRPSADLELPRRRVANPPPDGEVDEDEDELAGIVEPTEPACAPDVEPPEPPDHAAIRAALRHAAAGHAGHLSMTTAFDGDWSPALTHKAAAVTSVALLEWCTSPEEADPVFAREAGELRGRFGLADQTPDEAVRVLVPRGREFLGEVLKICAPVVRARQQAQADAGYAVDEARRSRWAGLDADDLSKRAVISESGSGVKTLTVDGASFEARKEDGGWRVHWPL